MRRAAQGIFIFLTSLLFVQELYAQEMLVHGGFVEDSLGVGGRAHFYLTVQYPSDEQLLFPDSTYDFKPFEFVRKEFFPTRTTGRFSRDSAVYTLTTFETEPSLRLRLPVFLIKQKDSLAYDSNEDSLRFLSRLPPLSDSALAEQPLRANTAYHEVDIEFNTMLWLGIACVLALAVIVLSAIFRRRIIAFVKRWQLEKRHRKFMECFRAAVDGFAQRQSVPQAETILSLWKGYLEDLLKIPITKLSSKEIRGVLKNEALQKSLHALDAYIYGGKALSTDVFYTLRHVSEEQFVLQLKKLKR